jgi:midasin (ATPase involved in ribosome maturation)
MKDRSGRPKKSNQKENAKMETKRTFREKWASFKYRALDLSKGEKITGIILTYVWVFVIGALVAYCL